MTRTILKWLTLWPLIVFAARTLAWLFPPLGFVLWRNRVKERREAALARRIVDETIRRTAAAG